MIKRKKRFKPLVIKNMEALNAFLNLIENNCITATPYAEDITAMREVLDVKSPRNILLAFFRKHDIECCDDGIDKIAGESGKVSSWKEYMIKHRQDHDGVRLWFSSNSRKLVGRYVDGNEIWDIRGLKNSKFKWLKWPLAKKKKSRRTSGRR